MRLPRAHAVGRAVTAAALIACAVFFTGLVPGFRAPASALPQVCIAALMALAVWVPFACGQLSLAQAGFMALGAYGSAWLTVHHGWPFAFALAAGAAGSALIGLAASYPALRLRGIYLAIATLGLGEVIRVVFLNLEATGGAFGFAGIPKRTETWHLAVALIAVSLLLFALLRGRIGRAIAAVREDAIVAAAFGIDVTRMRVLTFTLGAFLAGLAGGFQAHYVRFIAPENYGLAALIDWITMMIVGGVQTFLGVLAGALVIGSLPDMLHFASDWRLTINALLLMALLVVRPQGIVARRAIRRPSPVAQPELHPPSAGVAPRGPRSPHPAGAILALEGIGKHFGGVSALDSVSLAVSRHAIHGIIGPNGAGKTTLFNIVTGLYKADRGHIRFDDAPIDHLRAQQIVGRGMARTFQNIRLLGDMPVLENVMLGAHVRTRSGPVACALGLDRREERATRAHAQTLLDMLELSDRAGDPAGSLAYGDQRRLEIARALASFPHLLLLDEPAAGMNQAEAEALARIVRTIRSEFGMTIVLIDHDMTFVMNLCDDVTVLDFGRVIASGAPAAIQRDDAVARAYLGAPVHRVDLQA